MSQPVWIIGGGLAGTEIALQLAHRGISVRLFEMKPKVRTPAQNSDDLAELVCSNSFRAASLDNAVGLLKEEMRLLDGVLIKIADDTQVPAGGALAVDRTLFSQRVTESVERQPNIEIVREEVKELPTAKDAEIVVVATGPLTSLALSNAIQQVTGNTEALYFYDAIAPIVARDSIDMNLAFFASRYDKGDGDDYINCPMNQEEYENFIAQVLAAEKVTPRAFEEAKYFEGCLPIEVMAERGLETLRFGCMKPVGLVDPRTGRSPHAVVQLRAENRAGTAYNLVGFQSRMTWSAQKNVFRLIPGLAQAEFLRFGSVHRNTYLDAPRLLDARFRLKCAPHLRFAGQITGVEGYVESTACGLLNALLIATELNGRPVLAPPPTTALGALYAHVLGLMQAPGRSGHSRGHVPSNIHWGLFEALGQRAKKADRKKLYAERALADIQTWWQEVKLCLP